MRVYSNRFPIFLLVFSVFFCSEFICGSYGEVVPLNGSLANYTYPPPGYQAIMNVGVILPNTTVNTTEITVKLYAEFSMVALEIAAKDINQKKVIPDVYVNLLYASSSIDPTQAAMEIFSTADLLRANVSAVIGDLFSASTEYSALMTSKLEIPQCSFASGTAALSDRSLYKYFFRTEPNAYRFAFVLGEYIKAMNWTSVAMLIGDGDYGSTFAAGLNSYAFSNNINVVCQHTIFDINDDPTPELNDIKQLGVNIILLILNNSTEVIMTLQLAKTLGMYNERHAWLTVNNIENDIRSYYATNGGDINELNGFMMLDELLDLHGIVEEYDTFLSEWMNFPNLTLYNQAPNDMSFLQTHAYSCLMVIARGFNESLNNYEGGRAAGIKALQENTYDTTNLTPLAFNTNYTGPEGLINFTSTGDIDRGNYAFFYLWNGTSVQFGMVVDNVLNFTKKQVFFGNTTTAPLDLPPIPPSEFGFNSTPGILITVISAIGIAVCIATMMIVILYRHDIIIKSASPLFCCLELLGIMINYSSLYLILYTAPNSFICILRPSFISIAFILVMGGAISKSYRIHTVFNNIFAVRTNVRDAVLVRFVFVLICVNILLMVLWFAINPPKIIPIPISPGCNYNVCHIPNNGGIIFPVLQSIFLAALCLYAIYLAYKTRNVPARWNEAKPIAYVTYNVSLSCSIMVPTLFLPDSQTLTSNYLRMSAIIYVSTSTYIILFFPKLVKLFKAETASENNVGARNVSTPDTIMISPVVRPQAGVLSPKAGRDIYIEKHEGLMPVLEQKRWLSHFSVWHMRRIIVFPKLNYFVMVNDRTHIPKTVYYTSAERHIANQPNEYIIRVKTKTADEYLIQLKDSKALMDWLHAFNNRGMPILTTPLSPSDISQQDILLPSPKKAKTKGKRRTLDPEDDESILLTAKSSVGFVDTGSANSEGPSKSPLKEELNRNEASSLVELPFGSNTFGEVECETKNR